MIHLYNVTICETYQILCTIVYISTKGDKPKVYNFALHDIHMHTYAKSYD